MQIVPLYIIETLISIRLFLPNTLDIYSSILCFIKENHNELLIDNSVISDRKGELHYISFIYLQRHQPYVDILIKELEEYQK